jgi:phosphoribosylanthranilate isomerase
MAALSPVKRTSWMVIVQERRDGVLQPVQSMAATASRQAWLAVSIAAVVVAAVWLLVFARSIVPVNRCKPFRRRPDMWIKICGITRTDDAIAAMQAGVDAIGLNCFAESKRFIPVEQAVSIAGALRETAAAQPTLRLPELIGVFVNAATETIVETVQAIGLTGVQFHGDETPEQIQLCMARLPGRKCIPALRVSADRIADCLASINVLQRLIRPDAIVLDAFVPGQYGGTGRTVDPSVPAAWRLAPRPLLCWPAD